MGQFFQIAHLVQPVTGLFLKLASATNADLHFAEVWMIQGKILADVAHSTTNLAIGISRVSVALSLR